MRTFVVAAAAILAALPVSAGAQGGSAYDVAEIEAAIEIGARNRIGRIEHSCKAEIGGFWNKVGEALTASQGVGGQWHGIRSFRITGQPPMARVAHEAAAAKRQYRPVPLATDDHVLAIASADVFTVWVQPNTGGSMITASRLADTGVEHIVIRPRGDKEGRRTVQPVGIDVTGSETISNLFGASVDLTGVVATFASRDVIEIAQDADVEVVLVTTAGEFKCNLDDTRILRGYGLED
ncbi:MAG: hypothetical protein OXF93_04065 [Acidobacteria bacterium]|nr:hypothetical protein [Acidobacteriota bacterium]